MALDGVSWNIDYPLETLQPIIATNHNTFSSSALPNCPANEMTTASSIWPTLPLIGMPHTAQVGVSLGEALDLLASTPFAVSPALAANSSSWMNSTTEDAL